MGSWRYGTACMAGEDGECNWRKCPQVRDGESFKTGRHCPLDKISPETHTEAEAKVEIAKWIGGSHG